MHEPKCLRTDQARREIQPLPNSKCWLWSITGISELTLLCPICGRVRSLHRWSQ